jgi:hypothetical protein
MSPFPARVAKILDTSGRKELGSILYAIVARISNELLVALDGEAFPRSAEGTKSVLDGVTSEWADFWAILTIGTRYGATFGDVNNIADAKRKLGGVNEIRDHVKRDMDAHLSCLIKYIRSKVTFVVVFVEGV